MTTLSTAAAPAGPQSVPSSHPDPVELSDIRATTSAARVNDTSIPTSYLATPASNTSTSAMAEGNARPEDGSAAMTTSDATRGPSLAPNNQGPSTNSAKSAAGLSPAPQPAAFGTDSTAIGPSSDTMPTSSEAGSSIVNITLLLTTGARHPYKIDDKYLTKRNVNVPGVTEGGKKDPYSISVYTLKELILREWREEWEAQPSSPSSIRLIYFGKLLDDKAPLKGTDPF